MTVTTSGELLGSMACPVVEVISTGRNVELAAMLANLTVRGIGRLLVEGGTMIHTHFTSRRSDLVQYLNSR